jgi:DNA-binding MarR family transcriptional regulator
MQMGRAEEPDLDRIKRLLADVARSVGIEGEDTSPRNAAWPARSCEATDPAKSPDERLTTAIAWVRVREERDRIFGADLFFDPAWNILLDLYISERKGMMVSVSSMCIASKVPSTTALRWLTLIEKRGLIGRRPDDYDRRRSFLFLTDEGRKKIEATLDRAQESNSRLGIELVKRLN